MVQPKKYKQNWEHTQGRQDNKLKQTKKEEIQSIQKHYPQNKQRQWGEGLICISKSFLDSGDFLVVC